MKIASMQVPVPNSLLFIRDSATLERPGIEGSPHTWSTPSCVAVSCMPDCDGDTVITIGPAVEIGRADPPLFDRRLSPRQRDPTSALGTEQHSRSNLDRWTRRHEHRPDRLGIGALP